MFLIFWTGVINLNVYSLTPGNPAYDSLGSLGVGTLLGTVSAFLIYTNTEALLGRSIQAERVQKLTEFLENDPAVRSANAHANLLDCKTWTRSRLTQNLDDSFWWIESTHKQVVKIKSTCSEQQFKLKMTF